MALDEAGRETKKDKVPVYLMVVNRENWYWYSSVYGEYSHTLGVSVGLSMVGYDAGVGLGLPNTKPTISKTRLYVFLIRSVRTTTEIPSYILITQHRQSGPLFKWHLVRRRAVL